MAIKEALIDKPVRHSLFSNQLLGFGETSVDEMLNFIFSIESKTGTVIIRIIVSLFLLGVLDIFWHLLFQLPREKRFLSQTKKLFEESLDPKEWESLLTELQEVKVPPKSLVGQRISQMIEVKINKGTSNQDVLSEILIGRSSTKVSFARYILNTLIVFGLIGTLWGLSQAIIEVRPLITESQLADLSQIAGILGGTLKGMGTAFGTTLAGLLSSLILGILIWLFTFFQTLFFADFEEFAATTLTPFFAKKDHDSPTAFHETANELVKATKMLHFSTDENVRMMMRAVDQLADTSWEGRLEQQFDFANDFKETATSLAESLEGIRENQFLIKTTVSSFQKLTDTLYERSAQGEDLLRKNLEKHADQLINDSQKNQDLLIKNQNTQTTLLKSLSHIAQEGNTLLIAQLSQLIEENRATTEATSEQQKETCAVLARLSQHLQANLAQSTDTALKIEDITSQFLSHAVESQNELRVSLENQFKKQMDQSQANHIQVSQQGSDLSIGLEKMSSLLERISKESEERVLKDDQNARAVQEMSGVLSSDLRSLLNQFKKGNSSITKGQQEVIEEVKNLLGELEIKTAIEGQTRVFGKLENQLDRLISVMEKETPTHNAPQPHSHASLDSALMQLNKTLGAFEGRNEEKEVLGLILTELQRPKYTTIWWRGFSRFTLLKWRWFTGFFQRKNGETTQ